MTQDKTGGPAFPQSDVLYEDGAELVRTQHGGMTLRDWFAGQALTGMMMNQERLKNIVSLTDNQAQADIKIARQAYLHADAMIAARNGGEDT